MAHVPILEEHASDLVEKINVKGTVLLEKIIEKGVIQSEDARNIRVFMFKGICKTIQTQFYIIINPL